MDNIWRITNYDIYFGGKIYRIGDDLANKIQKDLQTLELPEYKLSVRNVEISPLKILISINRDTAGYGYYEANEGYICWQDACIFTGNFKGIDERGNIRLPKETCSSLFNHCFPINVLLSDYNNIVKERNWLLSLNCHTHKKYFTFEYEFIK